jgi:outer membrane protein insertion porin family
MKTFFKFLITLSLHFIIYGHVCSQINRGTIYNYDSIINIEKLNDTEKFKLQLKSEIKKLQSFGYINASVDSMIKKGDTTIALIYKGKQIYWKSFNLNFSSQNLKFPKFKYKKGQIVDLVKLNNYQEKIIGIFENNGFPFASIIPLSNISGDSLSIVLNVEKGKLYKFDSLVFNKLKITKNFLSGYLNIKVGEAYDEEIFQDIPKKIEQLNFLQLKTNPSITFGDGLARPELNISEKKSNYFNGLIGIVPDPDREKKYIVTGDVDLTLNNSLGRGEYIFLNWKKNDRYSQQLDASMKWPYIFRLPLGLEGQIKMLKQDTSYVDIETRTGIFIFFNGSNTASGYYKNKQTIILNPLDSLNIKKANIYGTGTTLDLKNLDNYLNPSKGYEFYIDISGGRRNTYDSINNEIKAGYIDGYMKIEGFIPLYKNWTLNLKHRFSGIYSDKKLYTNEYLRVGGLKTFRGFNENEFLSISYNTSTIELRWLFENLSHFKLFTDVGAFKTRTDDKYLIKKALGIGTGLNLHTNAGIFSISYALGRYHNTKFQLNNAKIHFGYINSF